jgi:hypothetical protein
LNRAFVILLSCIGTVYPESIRGTLVLYLFIELLNYLFLSNNRRQGL